jgi:hypothetical protein
LRKANISGSLAAGVDFMTYGVEAIRDALSADAGLSPKITNNYSICADLKGNFSLSGSEMDGRFSLGGP